MPKDRSKRPKHRLLKGFETHQDRSEHAGLKTGGTDGDPMQFSSCSSYDSDSSSSEASVTLEVCDVNTEEQQAASNEVKIVEALSSWIKTEQDISADAIQRLLHCLRPFLPTLPSSVELVVANSVKLDAAVPGTLRSDSMVISPITAGQQVLFSRLNDLELKFEALKRFVESNDTERRTSKLKASIQKASNEDELNRLAAQIRQDPSSYARLVERDTLRSTVRTFLKLTMDKDLASNYSWSGMGKERKRIKSSFRDCQLFAALTDVLHITQHSHANVMHISDAIKRVLSGVSDWQGGRSQRRSLAKLIEDASLRTTSVADFAVMNGTT